ncbi:MAG: hypothetical protein CMJ18_28150 [Phycisphaeraceae bacterium]|nr:hypothetical protein [Phycisphaeraceae bacterium]
MLADSASVTTTGTPATIQFSGGDTTIENGVVYDVDTTEVTGGTVRFETFATTPIAFTDTLTMSGGTLGGDGEIEVTSMLSWSGGTMGGDGTTRFSGASGSISGLLTLGRRFDNSGHITFSASQLDFDLSGTTSGVVNNELGALFDVTGEGTFRSVNAAGTYAFNNFGEFIRRGAGTTTKFRSTGAGSVPFNNHAVGSDKVHVQSGSLELEGGGTSTGVFEIDAEPADLRFTNDYLLDAGTEIIGSGFAKVILGTVTAGDASGEVISVESFSLEGGTLAGDGEIEVTSTLSWSGGTMGGDGTTRFSGGNGSISGLSLFLGRRFDNAGDITFSVTELSFNVSGSTSGEINNESGATFEVTGEGSFRSDDDTGIYAFNNFGEFIRRGVGTTTRFRSAGGGSVPFTNDGTIRVDEGTLSLEGMLTNFSGSTLSGGTYLISSVLRFPGANIVTNDATIVMDGVDSQITNTSSVDALTDFAMNTANGSFTIEGGRDLSVSGAFDNAGEMTFDAGIFALPATMTYTQGGGRTILLDDGVLDADTVQLDGGTLEGNGSIGVSLIGDLINDGGDVSPGLSTGEITVRNDYTQGSGGKLTIDIEDSSNFDTLAVAGDVTLDGELLIDSSTLDPSTLALGHEFNIVPGASAVTTRFASVTGSDLGGGRFLDVEYDSTPAVTLFVDELEEVTSISKDEGAPLNVTATFNDFGTDENFDATVTWGDGGSGEVPETLTVDNINKEILLDHVYADDDNGAGGNVFTVTVTFSDDDGSEAEVSFPVTVNNVNPEIDPISPLTVKEGETLSLADLVVSDDGFVNLALSTAETFTYSVEWGDGDSDTGDATIITSGSTGTTASIDVTHVYIDDDPTATSQDEYQVDLEVTDDEGGTDSHSFLVTVQNEDPTLSDVLVSDPIDENGTVTLSGTITDPGTRDTFTLEVNWGEGAPETFSYAAGTTSFSETHQYVDDNPTASSSNIYSIGLTLSDDDGGSHTDSVTTTVNNLAPTLSDVSVTPSIDENGTVTLSGTIADVGTQDTFTLEVNWGEGAPETFNYAAGTTSFSETHQYLDDNPTGSDSDMYTIDLTLTDDDGGTDTDSVTTTVSNVAPTLSGVSVTPSIDENGTVTLSGTIADVGTQDTFTLEVDWGEGTPETFSYAAGTTSFSEAHQYLDDNPTATGSDMYTIDLTLTDDDDGSDSASVTTTVNNVAPTLSGVSVTPSIDENGTVTLAGTITDAGTQDTFRLEVEWGEGGIETFNYAAGTTNFSETHQYLDDNPTLTGFDDYMIDLTLTDDDGGSDTDSVTTTVNNVAPSLSGVLVTPSIDENGTVTLSGTITDVGTQDSFTLEVDWGEGATETFNYTAGTTAFSETHQYLDDDPAGTSADTYVIDLMLTDDDGGQAPDLPDLVSTTVNNVDPTADAGPDQTTFEGTNVSLIVDFADIGSKDTHAASIDWGDGTTGAASVTEPPTGFTGDHVYADEGVYTVRVEVFDDDGGLASDVIEITVDNSAPTLTVVGEQAVVAAETLTLVDLGRFVDPGFHDPLGSPPTFELFDYTIDWGDDTASDSGSATIDASGSAGVATAGSFDGQHVYRHPGRYTVLVTVADQDGGSDSGTFDVMVTLPFMPVHQDYGDAPDSYATLRSSNGPRHDLVEGGVFLGASVDNDVDGQPDIDASGDDATDVNDDDGVVFETPLVPASNASISLTTSGAGELSFWIDFDRDGVFSNATEKFMVAIAGPGVLEIRFDIPATSTPGPTFARFRIGSTPVLSFDGPAPDGEVEDYAIQIQGDFDGVTDAVEDAGPNGGDGNDDGTPDSEQGHVASLPNSTDGSYVTVFAPSGNELMNVHATDNPSPSDAPADVEFPEGFIDFDVPVASGGATIVTLVYDSGTAPDTYYKYGPTPTNTTPHWYEFLYDGTTGAEFNGNEVTLHLVDGMRGDSDLTANGTIVDPGAPAFIVTPPQVVDVLVHGSNWNQAFVDQLEPAGSGGTRGHAIPTGGAQLAPLPWAELDQVILRFSEQVDVEQGDLALVGTVGPDGVEDAMDDYAFSAFVTETGPTGAFQAVWTLSSAIGSDRLLLALDGLKVTSTASGLALDGEWTNEVSSFPSGDGAAGGDFTFRFDVAPADVDRDGAATVFDIKPVRDALGSSAGGAEYSIFADLNGDAIVDDSDKGPLRANLGRVLPASEPQGGSGQGESGTIALTGDDRVVTMPDGAPASGSVDIVLDTDDGSSVDMLNYSVRVRLEGPGAGSDVLLTGGGEAMTSPATTAPDTLNAAGNLDRLPDEYYHGTVNFDETPFVVNDRDGLIRVDYQVQPGALGSYTFDIVSDQTYDTALIANAANGTEGFLVAAPRLIVTIPGDLNGDFTVGASDLQIILSNFTRSVPIGDLSQGDATGPGGNPDGVVGASDLQVILSNFTNSVTPPTNRAVARSESVDMLDVSPWNGWTELQARVAQRAPSAMLFSGMDAQDRIAAWLESRIASTSMVE